MADSDTTQQVDMKKLLAKAEMQKKRADREALAKREAHEKALAECHLHFRFIGGDQSPFKLQLLN